MATVQRNVKTYGNRNFVGEVASAPSNYAPILSNEVDADLDTIYAAWNGGMDSVNVKDGSISYAKLAPDAQLWRDTGTALTPGTNFAARPVVIAGPGSGAQALLTSGEIATQYPAVVSKGHVYQHSNANFYITSNIKIAGSAVVDDATQPSWALTLGALGNDTFAVRRAPPGSNALANLLTIDNAGNLTATGSLTVNTTNPAAVSALLPYSTTGIMLAVNNRWTPSIPANPSWNLEMDVTANATLFHRAGSAASGSSDQNFQFTNTGNLVISGSIGQKSAGTTWANPSDRRLKDEIADYATGLDAILQLQPRTFVYNGKGGSTAGMRGYGFIADEVEPVMPETVGVRAGKLEPDDDDETDIQMLDQSNLILALVNAVQELTARVATLEGAAA